LLSNLFEQRQAIFMHLAKRISFLILGILPSVLFGQVAPQLFFEQPYPLQRADLNSVTCIFKDSHHSMWFGTKNGLYRYDGLNLYYFGHKSGDLTSLPNNNVLAIAEGKDSQLWIALLTGVAEIDLKTMQCKTYSNANHRFDSDNFTNRICIDDTGNIWIGNNTGLFIFNKKKQAFSCVWSSKVPQDPLSSYVTSVVNADKHLLIASTFHSIIFFNKDNYSFKRLRLTFFNPPIDTAITSVFVDSKQKLWIGTWGGGIYTYDLATKELVHIDNMHSTFRLPFFYVTSFYETLFDKQRYILASTSAGLIKCTIDKNGNIENTNYIGYDKNNKYSIISDKLESLYFDSDGALWCGGDNGVCKCFPFQNSFKLFAALEGTIMDIQPVKIKNATCYFINSWNAASGLGFLFVDSKGKQAFNNLKPHFTNDDDKRNISGIAKDKYNRLWISSMAGVSVLDDKFNVIKQWNKNTAGENNLTYHRISGISIHNDTVWIICYHRGIDLFDLNFKKIRHYSIGDNSGLLENIAFKIYTDSKENLWICGNGDLYKYLPGTVKFMAYPLSEGPGGCSPRDVTETKNGDLIIASLSGLIKFNPHSEKYTYITSDLLEKEQSVYAAAIDKNGDIWFLTDKHLVHYKPNEDRFIFFGKEDGLDVSRGINELRTFNGTDFYICQDGQVIKFNCDSLNQSSAPPYLVVDIKANDSSIYQQDRGAIMHLPYNKNKLQFEFIGISYIKSNQNQYYYQLSDIDKQWNTTYKNAVSYANLSPGIYNFKVKCVNYAGTWSEEKIMHFVIDPPYWKTWWFRSFSAILVFSILFFIIRYISQRNLKEKILQLEKETAVEKERNRIAQDMHDDLGSGLTKIAILSEVAKKQLQQPEAASVQLEHISDSSRTLVDNLQDIIWMLNSKHDQLDSLVVYIREYATKYFEQSDIHVSFNYPTHIKAVRIPEMQRRNLFMAIKEALNNIAKHAEASQVDISFYLQHDIVNFVISDNGKGFIPDETRKFANGVKGMQSRMEQLGGTCNINSIPDKGTAITFSLSLESHII